MVMEAWDKSDNWQATPTWDTGHTRNRLAKCAAQFQDGTDGG